MTDDDDLLAAELALGLDPAPEAIARRAQDPAFAARVAWWEQQFAGLTGPLPAAEPSATVWTMIAAKLPANDNAASLRRWQWATGLASAVAAAALLAVLARPLPPPPVAPSAPLVASLAGTSSSVVAISYEAGSQRMTVAPVALDPGKGDAELWVIPVGATVPISMGVIDARKPSSRQLSPAQAARVLAGATFAVSLEPRGGSPTGHATGPIVVSGKLVMT